MRRTGRLLRRIANRVDPAKVNLAIDVQRFEASMAAARAAVHALDDAKARYKAAVKALAAAGEPPSCGNPPIHPAA